MGMSSIKRHTYLNTIQTTWLSIDGEKEKMLILSRLSFNMVHTVLERHGNWNRSGDHLKIRGKSGVFPSNTWTFVPTESVLNLVTQNIKIWS